MTGGNVTRTNRNLPVNRYPLRNFRNHSEKSQLDQILNDPELKELPVSKMNRMKSRRCEKGCLLYTSPSPRDVEESRMPSSA